jgi:hypothetical protein
MTLPPRPKHRTAAALIFEGGTYTVLTATRAQKAEEWRWLALGTCHRKEAALCIWDALGGGNGA